MSRTDTKSVLAPRRAKVAALAALVAVAALGAAAEGRGGSSAAQSAQTRDVAVLEAQLAAAKRDAHFWRQLIATFRPAKQTFGLNSMSDHRLLVLPGGLAMALHFDDMNLARAKNLNWVALAIPGRFTRADKARINRLYGPGFTHFHDFRKDSHGGTAATKGVWFVHVGTRNFTSPFGKVRRGKVDTRFMPTNPRR